MEGVTNEEEYSDKEDADVLCVQRTIIDTLYNARDVNSPKPCETAMRTCLTDLPPNDHKYRSINDADHTSDTPRRIRVHRSKSQSPDPKIANATKGAHLLENFSSTADKTHKSSTRSALLIAEYEGPRATAPTP